MPTRVRRAALLAILLALIVSPVLAAPAVNQWLALPAQGGGSAFGADAVVWGAETGPDGRLYAFGAFTNAGGDSTADYLAVHDPVTGAWSGLGSDGHGNGAFNSYVYDVAFQGTQVIAVGAFSNAGGDARVDDFAVWNGSSWGTRSSGSGAPFTNGTVSTVDVSGQDIYVGGSFLDADGVATADRVARWNGTGWSGLAPSGATNGSLNGPVFALDALLDGRVFVGGSFTLAAGDARAARIAWFDGVDHQWHGVRETGVAGPSITNGQVSDLAVVGRRIYVAGTFTDVAGIPGADYVAAWNGAAWQAMGQAVANVATGAGPLDAAATGLRPYGSTVIVAGSFSNAGGNGAADCVAAWNGSAWLNLGVPSPASAGTPRCTHGSVSSRTYTATGAFSSIAGLDGAADLAQFGLPVGPSAPLALAATAGTRSISLTWNAPAANGGAAITDYVVQYRVAGTTAWRTFVDGIRTTRSVTVTGLVTGTAYDLRVTAKNGWATGTFTAPVRKTAG